MGEQEASKAEIPSIVWSVKWYRSWFEVSIRIAIFKIHRESTGDKTRAILFSEKTS
jgi:hypothetical protein